GLDPLHRDGLHLHRPDAVAAGRDHTALGRGGLDVARHGDAAAGITPECEHRGQRRALRRARRERQLHAGIGARRGALVLDHRLVAGVLELVYDAVEHRTHHLLEPVAAGTPATLVFVVCGLHADGPRPRPRPGRRARALRVALQERA